MKLLARVGVLLGCFALATTARAAAPALPELGPPMKFQHVIGSAPGCEPLCPEWISAEGSIVPGTAAAFKQFLDGLGGRRLPILLTSPGGSTQDAIAMGRLIRARHFLTAVARTKTEACGAAGSASCGAVKGVANAFFGVCASACSMVFAGGEQRYASPVALIGVHQSLTFVTRTQVQRKYEITYRVVNGVKQEISRREIGENRTQTLSKEANLPATEASIAAFFRDMGINASLMAIAETTKPSEIRWLSSGEKQSTRLVTAWIDRPTAFVLAEGSGISAQSASPESEAPKPTVGPEPKATSSAPAAPKPPPRLGAGTPLTAQGQWTFARPVNGRDIQLRAAFSYTPNADGIVVTLETHFRDPDLESLFSPEVRGQGFKISITPGGDEYRVLKSVSGDPLRTTIPRTDFCRMTNNGAIVVEPLDLWAKHIDESKAIANPHEPPISIPAVSIEGMPALLEAACAKTPENTAATP
jgi:hypothetical protein